MIALLLGAGHRSINDAKQCGIVCLSSARSERHFIGTCLDRSRYIFARLFECAERRTANLVEGIGVAIARYAFYATCAM